MMSALVAGSLVVSACGTLRSDDPSETPATVPSAQESVTTPPPGGSPVDAATPPPRSHLAGLVNDAVVDLSTRLKVAPDSVEVIRAEQVTWPDGSLGCPRPGMSYSQALVDGYRVILEHAGRIYLYHAGTDGPIFLCPSDAKDGGHEFVPPPGFDE
jgi:hypothetical protein